MKNIDKAKVLKGLDFSEDARLDEDQLKAKYGDIYWLEDKATDTQGFMYLEKAKGILNISFRGTQQRRDWLTDFNAFHMIYPYHNEDTKIRVHQGFYKAYTSVREKIHNYVKLNEHVIDGVRVYGHSLGGAVGTLCAVDIEYNFGEDPGFYVETYISGNPMVGNRYFVKSYDKRVPDTTRTYMRRDIVPKLPPEWFERREHQGYSHAGNPFPVGTRALLFGILTALRKLFRRKESLLDDIFNHDINMYRDAVKKTL